MRGIKKIYLTLDKFFGVTYYQLALITLIIQICRS